MVIGSARPIIVLRRCIAELIPSSDQRRLDEDGCPAVKLYIGLGGKSISGDTGIWDRSYADISDCCSEDVATTAKLSFECDVCAKVGRGGQGNDGFSSSAQCVGEGNRRGKTFG